MGTVAGSRGRRGRARLAAVLLVPLLAGCSPIYVLKAGIAEARILAARRPIPEVILDPYTDEDTRGKLVLALEARAYAAGPLGLDVGKSYTTFTRLDRDTLALVLSAAHRDRLAARTWWFPVVGRVPYRGYFSLDDALRAQRRLEDDGLDTYLRPTAAFSTLGWFSDPLLSTLLRYDEVELVETILHELSHNHLFVSGRVTFNESFATFVGRTGAILFFCGRPGGGPDTVKCRRARDRWLDHLSFSRFLDDVVDELRGLYARPDLAPHEKIEAREAVFDDVLRRFREEVQPGFRSLTFASFVDTPLNNATLLARMRYYHRLTDFQALLDRHDGDLAGAVRELAEGARRVDDPFDLLPRSAPEASPGTSPR